MFNQINIQLNPSKEIAIALSMPFLAIFLLILSVNISAIWITSLSSILIGVFAYMIKLMALLKRPESIISLELQGDNFFAYSSDGTRFKVLPEQNAFIYPAFCLLTLRCISDTEEQNEQSIQTGIFSRIKHLVNSYFQFKTPRHMLICRYNISNPDAFRRLRVYLKLRPKN